MSSLAELSPDERPRERLLSDGAGRLEPGELIALVLGTGRGSGEDALQLAVRLLAEVGGLSGLAAADVQVLLGVRGIGPVKATRILAALELSRRARSMARATDGAAPGSSEAAATTTLAVAVPAAEAEVALADPPIDPVAACAERLRPEVPPGERAILGVLADGGGEPVTLALGEGLGPHTRPGSMLLRLMEAGGGPWWVVVLRPGGAPTHREREAAERVLAAALILGVRLEQIVVVAGRRHWLLSR